MANNNKDCQPLEITTRPWGVYEVLLDSSYCKVKRITVNPNQRLSYQKHFKREEYWTIVLGEATITLDGVIHTVKEGGSIHIPTEAWHRIANQGEKPVIFIEIQRGTYFGEDDIIRSEDDYGRS